MLSDYRIANQYHDAELYPEGIISGFFGSLTQKAVQRFQVKHGIVSSGTPGTTGYGHVGPKTRATLASVYGGSAPSSSSETGTTASASSGAFTKSLATGMNHPDIVRLQQLLNSDPDTQLTDTGAGSPGSETDFFGAFTRKAVQKFQVKYGIVSSGSPDTTGYGYVGPKTRSKLGEVHSL